MIWGQVSSSPFYIEQEVGNILLKTHLQELTHAQPTATLTLSDIVPSSVTNYEVSGYNSEKAILFGPRNYPKQAEILIKNVPIAVSSLKIQLLDSDGLVIGTATVPVTLSSDQTFTVSYPTFTIQSTLTPPEEPEEPVLPSEIKIVSLDSDGAQGNNHSGSPSISADGRFMAFHSSASNLVEGDTNSANDVFVHDRQTGQTTRVSLGSDGTQSDNDSLNPSISADGRFVAFFSSADNLVANDTNKAYDIFVHDRQTSQTTRVSLDSDENEGNSSSFHPSISADGRFVAFESYADNLVANDTNNGYDIFVHDRQTGETTRVSLDSNKNEGSNDSFYSSISADGRFVAFESYADNLVANDTNKTYDIFVHDRQTGITTRASLDSDENEGNNASYYPSISANGRFVAFRSSASNLVEGDTNGANDVFVHDLQAGQTTRVSLSSNGTQGNGDSDYPYISADGRFVAFQSSADDLVAGDTNNVEDIFVRDLQTEQTTRVSLGSDGTQGNDTSLKPSVSADGRFVAFQSSADDLVEGDTNNFSDIFAVKNPFTP